MRVAVTELPAKQRVRMRFFSNVVYFFICCAPLFAQDLQLDEGAVGTYLRLKQLQATGSVLHVVAHPDDEDGAMLAYCARELGARTMLFSLTRGEGGANMISSHFFDELGALRTLEHQKAASYYGIDLFYSRAADYGYSKTLEEAMQQWQNGVPLLKDLVEVIRREQPTILVSRFSGDPRDGHGHHQMAGVLSKRAIEAAADPSQFPEQITRQRHPVKPWQVKKFYTRAGSPWRPPKEGDWTIELPTGKYDPVIGMSPSQIARFGLGFQRSQGITGHYGDPGPKSSYYKLVSHHGKDKLPETEYSLFGGIDTSWEGLMPSEPITKAKQELIGIDGALRRALDEWNPRDSAQTVQALRGVHDRVDRMQRHIREADNLDSVRSDINRLNARLYEDIVDIAGFKIESWVTDSEGQSINHATPGEDLQLHIRVANQGELEVRLYFFPFNFRTEDGFDRERIDSPKDKLMSGEVMEFTHDIKVPSDVAITRPHWSRSDISKPIYEVDAKWRQLPAPSSGMNMLAKIKVGEKAMDLFPIIQVRRRDSEFGNVRYPVSIVPNKSIRFPLGKTIVQRGESKFTTSVLIRNSSKKKSEATLRLELPEGWSSEPAEHNLVFEREDDQQTVFFDVNIRGEATEQAHQINALVESEGKTIREGFETVTARDLGRMNIYHDAVQQVQIVDAKVLGDPKIGYIAGSGDKVAESLAPLGIAPTMLSESDLASGDLSQFDVILVGVRAYAVREDVRTHNSRLLAYVKQGGVLIVQYQTPEFDQNFGPYPYEMGRGPEEVSEELAEVTILAPKHPLFQTPNVITGKDFDGWFEQRGSKFWKTWDDKYTPLLECHDTAQPPQQGGQLIAKYGNGVYVYSAYAWYRQLPQGVPGAYRLFANMLSLPETK